ncbi:MAG: hypothetical protein U0L09_02075 [Christensenellales bacterium]|nr:hypothetical protein [Christensenellales bacterium]
MKRIMGRGERIPKDAPVIFRMINGFSGLIFSGILCLLLLLFPLDYLCKREYAGYNPLFLGAGLLIFGGVMLLVRRRSGGPGADGRMLRIVRWCTAALCAVELYIGYNLFFITGWDPRAVYETALSLSSGTAIDPDMVIYHAVYFNNVLLTMLQGLVLWIHRYWGLFPASHEGMALVVVNCVMLSYGCYCVFRILRGFVGDGYALAGYLICVLLVGLSPWMVVPYTDVWGLCFPVLTLRVYLRNPKSPGGVVWKWGGIILLSCWGYWIKPTTLIVYLAILIWELGRGLNRKGLLRLAGIVVATVLVFTAVSGCVEYAARVCGLEKNEEQIFGWPHFLMMGMNRSSQGTYSHGDQAYSGQYTTAESRQQANLRAVAERLGQMGPLGLAKHWTRKALNTYNDGMFYWGGEGFFYHSIPEAPNGFAAPLLRDLFYSDGTFHSLLASAMHMLWLTVLFFAGILSLFKVHRTLRTPVAVMQLSLSGLFVYLMLFEARARYLFIFVPFFIMLAVIGMHAAVKSRRDAGSCPANPSKG